MVDSSSIVNVDAYFALLFIFLTFFCIFLVVFYAEKGFPWHTYITCVIGYFCGFGVLICVPIDIGAILIDRRSRTSGFDEAYAEHQKKISAVYTVFYTIILILCGFVMCVEEYYNTDGKR